MTGSLQCDTISPVINILTWWCAVPFSEPVFRQCLISVPSCVPGGNGDAYEVHCPRTHDHRSTDDFVRVRAIRQSKHCRNAKRDEERRVERKGPRKEKRCEP